ncbi:unnamed protein product [Symbiodinium sp. CCMP2456]|nr:unnamed protein product [Symbiodinium sp. CCMP2456]
MNEKTRSRSQWLGREKCDPAGTVHCQREALGLLDQWKAEAQNLRQENEALQGLCNVNEKLQDQWKAEAQKLRQENETLQAKYNANESDFQGYAHWAMDEMAALQDKLHGKKDQIQGYVHWAMDEMAALQDKLHGKNEEIRPLQDQLHGKSDEIRALQDKLQGKSDEIRALVRELEDNDHVTQLYKQKKQDELEAKTAEAYKAEKEEEIRNECEWSWWYRQQWEALHKRMAEEGETDNRAAKSHRTA